MQVFSEKDKSYWLFLYSDSGTWTTYSRCESMQGENLSAPDTPSQPEELQHYTHSYFSTPQCKKAQFQNIMLHKEQP